MGKRLITAKLMEIAAMILRKWERLMDSDFAGHFGNGNGTANRLKRNRARDKFFKRHKCYDRCFPRFYEGLANGIESTHKDEFEPS